MIILIGLLLDFRINSLWSLIIIILLLIMMGYLRRSLMYSEIWDDGLYWVQVRQSFFKAFRFGEDEDWGRVIFYFEGEE